MYRALQAQGARWVELHGWRVPDAFRDPDAEAQGVRAGVGLQDVSALGKLDLKGRDAGTLWKAAAPTGSVAVLRLTSEHALVLTPPGEEQASAGDIASGAAGAACFHVTDVTSAFGAFAVVGPRARELLLRVTSLDLREGVFANASCAEGELAQVHAIVNRDDWGSLSAFRILVSRDTAEYAWDTMRAAGRDLDLTLFGRAAEQQLRAGA